MDDSYFKYIRDYELGSNIIKDVVVKRGHIAAVSRTHIFIKKPGSDFKSYPLPYGKSINTIGMSNDRILVGSIGSESLIISLDGKVIENGPQINGISIYLDKVVTAYNNKTIALFSLNDSDKDIKFFGTKEPITDVQITNNAVVVPYSNIGKVSLNVFNKENSVNDTEFIKTYSFKPYDRPPDPPHRLTISLDEMKVATYQKGEDIKVWSFTLDPFEITEERSFEVKGELQKMVLKDNLLVVKNDIIEDGIRLYSVKTGEALDELEDEDVKDFDFDGEIIATKELKKVGISSVDPQRLPEDHTIMENFVKKISVEEMKKWLKSNNVNKETSDRFTPLHFAAKHGKLSIVKLLLENGAYLHAAAKNDWTPLLLAAARGNKETVTFLIKAGADPYLKTIDSNKDAIILAKERLNFDIIKENLVRFKDRELSSVSQVESFYYVMNDHEAIGRLLFYNHKLLENNRSIVLDKTPLGLELFKFARFRTDELFRTRTLMVLDTLIKPTRGIKKKIFERESDEETFAKIVLELIRGTRLFTYPIVNTKLAQYLKRGHFQTKEIIYNLPGIPTPETGKCFAISIKASDEKELAFKNFLGNINKKRSIGGDSKVDTVLLFHGSNMGNWDSILKDGMILTSEEDMSNDRWFGKGVYFSDVFGAAFLYSMGTYRVIGVFEVVSTPEWLKRVKLENIELVYGTEQDSSKNKNWADGMILRYLIVEKDPENQTHSSRDDYWDTRDDFDKNTKVDSEKLLTFLEQDFMRKKIVDSNLNTLKNAKQVKTSSKVKPFNNLKYN